jgi:hypothetical protein
MKMKTILCVVTITASVSAVAWVVFMFAPLPAYRTREGAIITRTIRLLPPSECGMGEELYCGKRGGTNCRKFGFIER